MLKTEKIGGTFTIGDLESGYHFTVDTERNYGSWSATVIMRSSGFVSEEAAIRKLSEVAKLFATMSEP